MADPSSRLDDSDMLEYLDTIDSDSDFIPRSDTDDTSEEDATPPAAHPVSHSEEDDMDDEDYRKILSPKQPLPLPFQLLRVFPLINIEGLPGPRESDYDPSLCKVPTPYGPCKQGIQTSLRPSSKN
jgi:hypothetical protein